MKTLDRASMLLRRSLLNPAFPNVSFLPLSTDTHPAWMAHVNFLQDKTAWPLPGKTLHVVNRLPNVLKGFRYVSETEALFSILHKDYTRSPDFSVPGAVRRIEKEVESGKLRRIIFQSRSAFEVSSKWMTPRIEAISRTVQVVPQAIQKRPVPASESEIKILTIGSSNYRKGLFLLKNVIPAARRCRPDISFTCVSSVPLPGMATIDGLEVLVIDRMDEQTRRWIYASHHYLLNLSLGNALGVFLECCQFNIPMIGYPGQHGGSFVPVGTGLMLEAPIFELEEERFDLKWTIRDFPDYLAKLHEEGFFRDAEDALVESISGLDAGGPYAAMLERQFEFAQKNLSVDSWLTAMARVYDELD
ncbi:MAG: hypothetical protein ABIK82_22725 [Pseudomonadota bacterium]